MLLHVCPSILVGLLLHLLFSFDGTYCSASVSRSGFRTAGLNGGKWSAPSQHRLNTDRVKWDTAAAHHITTSPPPCLQLIGQITSLVTLRCVSKTGTLCKIYALTCGQFVFFPFSVKELPAFLDILQHSCPRLPLQHRRSPPCLTRPHPPTTTCWPASAALVIYIHPHISGET